jgi:hypothetical protein
MAAIHSRGNASPATGVESFHGDSESRERELVQTQVLMREVNEQIHQLSNRFGERDSRTVICECAHGGCATEIEISPDDYNRVRNFPTRFVVVSRHEDASIERVVENHNDYLVVEKVGLGAAVAIRFDPRRRHDR